MEIAHLARRFVGSLWPLGPSASTETWVLGVLSPGESTLWRRMSRADRRHAAGVARRVESALGAGATRPVLAAALLHDVGKIEAGLGTWSRVVATVAGRATKGAYVSRWAAGRGFTRRVGLYLRHAPLGANLLSAASSDALTIAWAGQHHLPTHDWTVPAEIAAALKAADDD